MWIIFQNHVNVTINTLLAFSDEIIRRNVGSSKHDTVNKAANRAASEEANEGANEAGSCKRVSKGLFGLSCSFFKLNQN